MLVVTTTFPLLYLLWQSLQNINLAMPGMNRFVGAENYVRMWEDRRFWGALGFTVIYTMGLQSPCSSRSGSAWRF